MTEDRCYAVVGTATFGPMYCGNKAKTVDANGRPICGVHKKGNPGIEWRGDGHRYPYGTGGRAEGHTAWRFARGEYR